MKLTFDAIVVEDEAAVRASTREFLQSIGYIVLEARNAQDALEPAREYDNPIDLLISDVVMPGMSGAKLASVLTAQRPEMRVFFVSGYAESTVLRHGNVDVGARLLQKPFSLRAMVRKVRKVLESHSAPAISVWAAGAAR